MHRYLGKPLGLIAIGLVVSSCTTNQDTAFASGTTGQVVGRADGCRQVMLIPSSTRGDAMIAATFGGTEKGSYRVDFENRAALVAAASAKRPAKLAGARVAPCGAYSEFVFSDVSAGTYYVTTARQYSQDNAPLSAQQDSLRFDWEESHYEVGMMERVTLVEGSRARVRLEPKS